MKIKKLTKEQRGEKGFSLGQEIINNEKERRRLFLINAGLLSEIFDKQYYKDILGDEEGTWSAYLSEIEIYYSRAEVERWRKIWKKFVIELDIDPVYFVDIAQSRLEDIMRIVNTKQEAGDWFDKARSLPTPLDWKNVIAEFYGKPTSENCKHDFQGFEVCNKCGEKHKL